MESMDVGRYIELVLQGDIEERETRKTREREERETRETREREERETRETREREERVTLLIVQSEEQRKAQSTNYESVSESVFYNVHECECVLQCVSTIQSVVCNAYQI